LESAKTKKSIAKTMCGKYRLIFRFILTAPPVAVHHVDYPAIESILRTSSESIT
jgi:hypothetical protein